MSKFFSNSFFFSEAMCFDHLFIYVFENNCNGNFSSTYPSLISPLKAILYVVDLEKIYRIYSEIQQKK
jgi:hypothetical protein